jgi:Alpha/beta hydrolase domain
MDTALMHSASRSRRTSLLKSTIVAALGCCALFGAAQTARAAVTSVSVVSSEELGSFDHRAYREVELRVRGLAPGGPYDVPVTLAYPTSPHDASGVALVDIVNTVFLAFPTLPSPATAVPLYIARSHLGDDYLFGSGHAYLSVNWDKDALAREGTGTIADHDDAYTVIRDVAALARHPTSIPAFVRPIAASTVVAYGFSQTGALLRGFYHEHANSVDGLLAFDGSLFGGASGGCLDPGLGSLGGYACGDGPVSDGGKVIAYSSETDAEWFGYAERGQTSNYRMMEIAGTSHIPTPVFPFTDAPAQNPADFRPVVRASFRNLIAWIAGTPPPASNYITLLDEVGEFLGLPFREAVRDADGNALGGVRLPSMPVSSQGREIGAPLGTYAPFEFATDDFFILLSGHFTPFDEATLDARYPTHGAYVSRVAQAAHRLVERREILQADAQAYIREAVRSPIGR